MKLGRAGIKAIKKDWPWGEVGVNFLKKENVREILDALDFLNERMKCFQKKFVDGLYVTLE